MKKLILIVIAIFIVFGTILASQQSDSLAAYYVLRVTKGRKRGGFRAITAPIHKAVNTINRGIRDPIKGAGDMLKAGAALSTFGLSSAAAGSMRKTRREANKGSAEAEASLAAQQADTKKLEEDARKKYESGVIDEGAKAQIDRQRQIREAQAKQSLGEAGISSSTAAVQTQGTIDKAQQAEVDTARDREFSKSMEALGMDKSSIDAVSAIHEKDRASYISSFQSVMGALGSLTAVFSGKGKGA